MALKDTLARIEEEKQKALEFEEQKPQLRAERSEAIGQLMTRLDEALSEFVASGQLRVQRAPVTVSNDAIGPYAGEMLTITPTSKPSVSVQIKPSNGAYMGLRDVVEIHLVGVAKPSEGRFARLTDRSTGALFWAIQAAGVEAPPAGPGPTAPRGIGQRFARPQQNQPRVFVPLTAENFLAALDHLLS